MQVPSCGPAGELGEEGELARKLGPGEVGVLTS